MENQIDKFVDQHLILYDTAKFTGTKDAEKLFWYEHLIYCDYNEVTNHCFWGYLEGVGTHDRIWMLERYNELIKNGNADCIRFIDVMSFAELDELVTLCFQNNVNAKEKSFLIHVFYKFLKNIEKDCIFGLSVDAQISFLDLLLGIANHHGSIVLEASEVYRYFIPHLTTSSAIESAATTISVRLMEYWKDSIYPEQKKFIKSMVGLIYSRFSDIKTKYENEKSQAIESFFKPLVSDYLSSHSKQLEDFKVSFPYLGEIFIEPLKALSFSKTSLYRFFCEPIFFRKIFIFVHISDRAENKTIYLNQLQFLEDFFAKLAKQPDCSNFSKKVTEFIDLMSSKSLNNILGAAFGLYGEINTLRKVWDLKASSSCFSHIEIPLETDSKKHKKIGDVRLFLSSTHSYQCLESKCKKPGFGFDGDESRLNDYLMNIIPLISGYINICLPIINMFRLFPRLVISDEHIFGCLSDLINAMSKKGIRVNYSENELSKLDVEKEIIKNTLECFYDDEFIMSDAYLLPSDEEILNEKKRLAEILFAKDFLRNTIRASLEKFQDENKRARENNSSVDSFVICWTVFIPDCLIYNPFLTQDRFTLDLVEHIRTGIREIFDEIVLVQEFSDLKNQKIELLFL